MITIKDLLRDFQQETIDIHEEQGENEVTGKGIQEYKDVLADLLDEVVRKIRMSFFQAIFE